MDAVEFLTEKRRMCDSSRDCCDCKLYKPKTKCCFIDKTKEDAEKAVEIVERWSKEHPRKTRASEFLKLFPNVKMSQSDCLPALNPCALDLEYKECALVCSECRRKFWTEEIK